MEITQGILIDMLYTILVFGTMFLLYEIIKYFKTKTALIKNEKVRTLVNNAFDDLMVLITKNIHAVELTTKPMMIEAIKDGKIDKSELNALSQQVTDKVLKQMGEEATDILNKNLKDVEGFINAVVIEQVAKMKEDETDSIMQRIDWGEPK